ncbi:hypothetical protein LSTR_LSTR002954 [Laodelphax striatellus]|uniref:Uncharacterized protein n=1 Tax=Laodelphax striatellus TaxID=195883 RepID=A0A482XLC4_LAOST|nr:hypothetical protein LSTR_LSTR002954 [Laodelphax striatellus]
MWEIDVYMKSQPPFHLGVGRLSNWKIEPDQVPELDTQKLESGNTVIISSFHDINTIYVQPRTTQLRDLYECLSQEVAAECIKGRHFGNSFEK